MKRQERNRALQRSIPEEYTKGVKLVDIDSTIAEYMSDVVIPNVVENGNVVKIPLLYGNAERWHNIRKEGYLRDKRGQIQIPLVMFTRNSIDRNDSMANFKEASVLPAYKKWSKTNRYDRFSLLPNAVPTYEHYNISVPHYVTLTYEVMIWTSFTEHMNKIVEAFQYATDRYWGKREGYRFQTRIDSFDNEQEVGEGSERIIRTSFTMVVNAYLLPERDDGWPNVKKSFTPKRIIFGTEAEINQLEWYNYKEYQDVINFMAIRNQQTAEYIDNQTVKLTGVELPPIPNELRTSFNKKDRFVIFADGNKITDYTYDYIPDTNTIIFHLDEPINYETDIYIIGKYLKI